MKRKLAKECSPGIPGISTLVDPAVSQSVIPAKSLAAKPYHLEDTAPYQMAYAKAQAGGMNSGESHEFALDQAVRVYPDLHAKLPIVVVDEIPSCQVPIADIDASVQKIEEQRAEIVSLKQQVADLQAALKELQGEICQ